MGTNKAQMPQRHIWTLGTIPEIWTRNRRAERWQFRLFQIDFRS